MGDIFGQGGGFSDFFRTIFGGGFQQRQGGDPFGNFQGHQRRRTQTMPGQDVTAELSIPFMESLTGATKMVNVGGESISIKIPPGITDGKKLRLKGKGMPGMTGGPKGDLYIRINVQPDSRFERKGNDLYMSQPVDLFTLILGGSLSVRTPHNQIKLNIPAGTPNGKRLKVSGHGAPEFGKPENRGNLYVQLMAKIPEDFTAEEKRQLAQMAERRNFEF